MQLATPAAIVLMAALLLPGAAVGYALHSPPTGSGGPIGIISNPFPPPPVQAGTWVILVHGFNPTTVPATSVWYYGQDMYAQLIEKGYHVGVVSYYGSFVLTLSDGRTFIDPSFFGTTNTPIEAVGHELGRALQYTFGAQQVNLDIVAHSMGGLVTLYMLEHTRLSRVHLGNIVLLGSPMGGAPITALSAYDNMSGYQAQEMENGSNFLKSLRSNLPLFRSHYPTTEWLTYAGDANPPWGVAYFGGPNDGLVAVSSDVALGYNHEYTFPDLHIPSLDGYDPGHVSYFEDPSLLAELFKNLAGHY